jgi:hypothetical protein
MIIKEMHNDVGGGHFSAHIINQKILDAKYWWPTLYKDVQMYSQYVMFASVHEIYHWQVWPI